MDYSTKNKIKELRNAIKEFKKNYDCSDSKIFLYSEELKRELTYEDQDVLISEFNLPKKINFKLVDGNDTKFDKSKIQ